MCVGRPVACMLFGSAAWKAKSRDSFIGWDRQIRERNLPLLSNNTLKTKGYHLKHNFGHGTQHLSSLLATMNILAFLFHSFLSFCDDAYRLIRATLPTRKTFFRDIRALLRYHRFASWSVMMDFMMFGLEIGPYEVT